MKESKTRPSERHQRTQNKKSGAPQNDALLVQRVIHLKHLKGGDKSQVEEVQTADLVRSGIMGNSRSV